MTLLQKNTIKTKGTKTILKNDEKLQAAAQAIYEAVLTAYERMKENN